MCDVTVPVEMKMKRRMKRQDNAENEEGAKQSKVKQSKAISLRSGMTPPPPPTMTTTTTTTVIVEKRRKVLTEKVFPSRGALGPVEERRSVGSRIEQTG
jgi:hypothetical protein